MILSDLDEIRFAREGMGEGPQTGGAAGAVGEISAVDALMLARRSHFKLEVDGNDLAYEVPDYPVAYSIIDVLRHHKPEIVGLLRDERRAVVQWIADNFRSSAIDQCALCGSGKREDDPFVAMFVGEDRADVHASCYPAWIDEQEARARVVLGIEPLAEVTTLRIGAPCQIANVNSKGPRHEPRNL